MKLFIERNLKSLKLYQRNNILKIFSLFIFLFFLIIFIFIFQRKWYDHDRIYMFIEIVVNVWSLRIEQNRRFDWSRESDLDDISLFELEWLFGFGNNFLSWSHQGCRSSGEWSLKLYRLDRECKRWLEWMRKAGSCKRK